MRFFVNYGPVSVDVKSIQVKKNGSIESRVIPEKIRRLERTFCVCQTQSAITLKTFGSIIFPGQTSSILRRSSSFIDYSKSKYWSILSTRDSFLVVKMIKMVSLHCTRRWSKARHLIFCCWMRCKPVAARLSIFEYHQWVVINPYLW